MTTDDATWADTQNMAPVLYDVHVKAVTAVNPERKFPAWKDVYEDDRTGWLAVAFMTVRFGEMTAEMMPDMLRATGVALTPPDITSRTPATTEGVQQ